MKIKYILYICPHSRTSNVRIEFNGYIKKITQHLLILINFKCVPKNLNLVFNIVIFFPFNKS